MILDTESISGLNEAETIVGDEEFEIIQNGFNRRLRINRLISSGSGTNYGYIASGSGPGISVDTTARTITLTGRVTSGNRNYLLENPVVIPYTPGVSMVLSVSLADGTASLIAASAAQNLPNEHAILGTINTNTGNIVGVGGEYFIDGFRYEPANTEAKYGYVSSSSGPGISVDTVAKTVTIQGRLTSGPRHRLIGTPQVLPYSGGTALIISASLATGEGLLSPTNISTPLPREHVILGTLSTGNGRISGAGGEYILDGQHYMPPIVIPNGTATADFWGTPSDVEIDTTARTITFASGVRISDGRRTRLSNASVIDYTSQTGTFFIVIDDSTGDPRLVQSNQLQNISLVTPNDFVLGIFRTGTGRISGLVGGFTRNGEIYEAESPTSSGPVIPEKTPENADFWGTPSSVQVDTTAKTITFPGGGRINAGRRSRVMPTYTIDYSGQTGTFFIVIHESTGNPRLVPGNQIQNNSLITQDDLILGQFRTANGKLSGFPGGYTLNGVEYLPDLPETSGPVVPEKVAENVRLWGTPSSVQVDTVAKTITFANGVRMSSGRRSRTTNSQTIDYTGLTGNFFIVYDDTGGDARLVPSNQLQNTALVTPDDLIVGYFRSSSGAVEGLPGGYRLDGTDQQPDTSLSFLLGNFFGNVGGSGVSFNTSTKIITFSGILIADGFSTTLSNVTYNYSGIATQGGWRFLSYNKSNGNIGVSLGSGVANLSSNSIPFMAFRPTTLEVQGISQGVSIDGVRVGGIDKNYCIPLSDPSTININFIEQQFEMGSDLTILHRGFRIIIPQQTVDFSHIPPGVWSVIIFDPLTNEVAVTLASQRHGDFVCVLGALKTNTESVVGFEEYSVNGVAYGVRSAWKQRTVSMPWDIPYDITVPALPGHTSSDPMPLANMVSTDIYDLYDALMADHPAYITKNFLGNDASGLLPIYEYRFSPPMARTDEFSQGAPEHMRVLILSLHSEQINYVFPYYFMKMVCDEWETDPAFEAFRWGVEWSVVPALNPYAVDNKQRTNANGVDLNRNFPSGWTLLSPGDFYSGPTPMSEPETQYAYALLKEFKPHAVFDCHSFGTKASPIENTMFWWGVSDEKARTAVGAVLTRLAHKWQKENPFMPSANELGYTAGSRGAGLFRTTALDLGSIAVLFESAWSIPSEPGAARGTPLTIRYATEGLANCISAVIKAINSGG